METPNVCTAYRNTRDLGARLVRRPRVRALVRKAPCLTTTPFGLPVLPDVYMMYVVLLDLATGAVLGGGLS